MSDTTLDELGSLRWRTPPFVPTMPARDISPVPTTMPLELPIVRPGELWLVEVPLTEPELAPLEYGALRTANVVIYDRPLAGVVARHLPLGSYAEPAALSQAQSGSACERCVRFVRDGWSVARLFYPGLASSRERLGKVLQLRQRLLALGAPADLPVQLFVSENRGTYGRHQAPLYGLDVLVPASAAVGSPTLTLAFDATRTDGPSHLSVASTNGLAG